MNKYLIKLLTVLFLLSFGVNAQVNFPVDSSVQIVSDGMIVDGVKMQAWDFKSKRNLEFNLNFFKNEWEDESKKYTYVQYDGWDIINAVIDDVIYTAKLKSAGKNLSYGFVATSSKLDGKLSSLNKEIKDFPQPSSTQLLREIKSIDGSKKSSTMILTNRLSVIKNLDFYSTYFKKYNWTINKSMFSKNKKKGAFLASNGPSNVSITFDSRANNTFITAVRVDVE
ncbi:MULTISPECIES: hypothetical protein [Pseudoalteromonas]|uniref:Uncharacterized protein n=1 Tax=Pseudoalteromonas arctica A 37-1-2 TaxID=1117313 RepID=A0A290S5G0_9GAMM|nr:MULTISPECIES: hypothetical protein [Pseudoalteromonas]ATC86460.1 hypothetical protein PARC_a1905 [Pseudoalteromonas arctica A 37-1-2]MBH0001967.1 hypothetical protein [Pseudoalteromonas sp. SWYJZ12]